MDLVSLFPFDWAEMTRTDPAGGVKLAVVRVLPLALTTAGVEASSAIPAAAAGGGGAATRPTKARAAPTTNNISTRACDRIRFPLERRRLRLPRKAPTNGDYSGGQRFVSPPPALPGTPPAPPADMTPSGPASPFTHPPR